MPKRVFANSNIDSQIDKKNIIDKRLPRTRSKGPTPLLNNKIQFRLDIMTDKERVWTNLIMNRFEQENARIVNISRTELYKHDADLNEHISLTIEECNAPGFIGDQIKFFNIWYDRRGHIVDCTNETFYNDKGYFTVQEMADIILDFEKMDRPKTRWFGGIDAHHIFFEGIEKNTDGSYRICWGS